MIDVPNHQYSEICKLARDVWAEVYGVVRASGSANRVRRRDQGCPREKNQDPARKPSLAEWLRRRQASVRQLTQEARGDASAPSGRVGDAQVLHWTREHEKEAAHLKENCCNLWVQ